MPYNAGLRGPTTSSTREIQAHGPADDAGQLHQAGSQEADRPDPEDLDALEAGRRPTAPGPMADARRQRRPARFPAAREAHTKRPDQVANSSQAKAPITPSWSHARNGNPNR